MPDYMFLLESRLSPEQRAAMMRVQELAAAMGLNIYLAGGTVRDLVTGATLRDLDFTIEGNPSKIASELEKGGAEILSEGDKLRHVELLFAGEVEGSIAAARDDHYVRPGTRPEIHWSSIMEDLRRRDFSLNAIAISLNTASRGLLLDPTNGLSDIEHGEVRALTIHSFTNQPVRLLRALRVASRMGFKLESRTQEWFNLAIERELQHTISPEDAGEELRGLAKEERPHLALKDWESHHLMDRVHPLLAKKHPDYEAINRLIKVRDDLFMAGFRPRLATPMMLAILGRLKDRELSNVLGKLGFLAAEIDAIETFPEKAQEIQKELNAKKTKTPADAYRYIDKVPMEYVAYLLAESNNSAAISKLKAFLHKWRPIRLALPIVNTELEALGMPHGPKFEQVVQDVFALQLNGRGKTPEERIKILRKLSGIKEVPKKKEKEKKPVKGEKAAPAAPPPPAKPLNAGEKRAAQEKFKAGMKAAAAKKSKPKK
jgi:tRNA nucleotidyltransferase (CCA-adding enzyme)